MRRVVVTGMGIVSCLGNAADSVSRALRDGIGDLLDGHSRHWVEAPLRDAVTKGLDSASATQDLQDLVTTMYNIKDPQATPWTMDAHTLGLSAGAFSFNASRTVP